jgi:hypothetical protein
MGRQRTWTLTGLKAEWKESRRKAPTGSRYQTGFSFICPSHASHRLRVQLVNPGDGEEEEAWANALRAERSGKTIGELTLTTPSGQSTLDFGPCGKLWVIEGRVYWAV